MFLARGGILESTHHLPPATVRLFPMGPHRAICSITGAAGPVTVQEGPHSGSDQGAGLFVGERDRALVGHQRAEDLQRHQPWDHRRHPESVCAACQYAQPRVVDDEIPASTTIVCTGHPHRRSGTKRRRKPCARTIIVPSQANLVICPWCCTEQPGPAA
jgi:hypothetical protein